METQSLDFWTKLVLVLHTLNAPMTGVSCVEYDSVARRAPDYERSPTLAL